jgi:DNA-directed RNA polymerase sigma subunit (sigma70/sigma32)
MSDDKYNNPHDETRKILEGLTERELSILKKKFNLVFDDDISLEDTLKQFDAIKERIKEIKKKY